MQVPRFSAALITPSQVPIDDLTFHFASQGYRKGHKGTNLWWNVDNPAQFKRLAHDMIDREIPFAYLPERLLSDGKAMDAQTALAKNGFFNIHA